MQVLDRKLACWVAKLAALFAILGIAGVGDPASAEECPPEAPRYSPNALSAETCPDIGRMGSLKLAIPRNYILGPDFVYEGEDIWKPDFHKHHVPQSFEREIRYFSIRVRLNDLKPVENEIDTSEFSRSMTTIGGVPSPDKQSVFMVFDYRGGENFPIDWNAALQRYIRDSFSSEPSFLKLPSQIDLLDHYVSPVQPSKETVLGDVNEVFFDPISGKTIITCNNFIRRAAPFDLISSCLHRFFLEDGSVEVQVNNIKDKANYLLHWKQVEMRSSDLFRSFVVK